MTKIIDIHGHYVFEIIRKLRLPVQINAYSLVEERDEEIRDFARKLLQRLAGWHLFCNIDFSIIIT